MNGYIYHEKVESFEEMSSDVFKSTLVNEDSHLKGYNPVVLCSKELPVIQIPEEEDGLLENLLPFKIKVNFKEVWVSEKKYCYFGLDPNIYSLFNKTGDLIVRHYSSVLHEFWMDTESVFHVDFEHNFMHFYIKMDGSFLFYNKLAFENVADVHYNIAFVEKEIFPGTRDYTIVFSGEISKESIILKGLNSYFSNIRFLNDGQTDFLVNGNKIESRYFDLYALASCV